jgi:broad specificity phosphatase PhoE
MTKFLLIRHATTDVVGKHLSGRMPGIHLNDAGKEEAQQLATRLKGYPIHAIYSSPLDRALETAAAIGEITNLSVVVLDYFLEIDFGNWTNRSFEELQRDPNFQRFNTLRSVTRIPGGETMQEAQSRFIAGLEKLRLKHDNETVAILSHSDMIKSAVAYYGGINLDMFQRIEISTASISVLELDEDYVRIVAINHSDLSRL